jgi:multidrug resistance efflux pump
MKKNLEAQHKELEEKRRQLEDEKNNWEAQQRVLEQQKLDSSRYNTLLQHISIQQHYMESFTFTFKSFSRRSYPERLTKSTMNNYSTYLCGVV